MASRLVRLETGSSNEAELAIRRQAWAPGRAETPAAAAAVRTTGVSSTTVASSESVVVTRAPSRNTPVNRGTGRSRPSLRTQPAAAAKRPDRPQTSPTTRIVTRKSTTGPRCCTSSRRSSAERAPVARVAAAAARPMAASVRPRGWA